MDTEQSEPQFASLGALLAYEHRTNGAEHLNRVLTAVVEAGETRREFLLLAACEPGLAGVGRLRVGPELRVESFTPSSR
jgi:hypothetical protein